MITFRILSYEFEIKKCVHQSTLNLNRFTAPYSLHFGPGPGWLKPDDSWITIDADPERGDIVCDFGDFKCLELPDQQVSSVYGSHVFEHVNPHVSNLLFREIYRVLVPGGSFRLVLPDVARSIKAYLANDFEFSLFRRRRERAKAEWRRDYTAFDCLREDFVSLGMQHKLLGDRTLAHQNAWDYTSLACELDSIGFETALSEFQGSACKNFAFEGTYPSEANEVSRSLYVEAVKPLSD